MPIKDGAGSARLLVEDGLDNRSNADNVAASPGIYEKSLASGSARKSSWHDMVLEEEQNSNTDLVRDTVRKVVEETHQVSDENNMVLKGAKNTNIIMGIDIHMLVEETQQVCKQASSMASVAQTLNM